MAEIGRQVGCSRENVRQLLTNSGHYKDGCRLDRSKLFVLELRSRGYTLRECARTVGCSKDGVFAALKRWGVGRGRVKRAQKQYEERRMVCRKET
jgi:DNA-binding CsgD family transcriptional regulator